ncbi:ATP-dependent RNA helicase eIF4A [Psilocybe cubensis]|nr:ATP-dependent RNA helicase eIF4A [Psilocybe cubensis]KAH9482448.1 ATP-dependent RNA helicase eIF4A [Psilocybe cubensis]
MARSAALNPASMPFFPGGYRGSDDERGTGAVFGQHTAPSFREQDRSSALSFQSVAPTEFRSVRSSPSPAESGIQEPRHQSSPGPRDIQRQSPTIRQADAGKPYPAVEARLTREGSMIGTLGTLAEREDTQSPGHIEEDQAPESGHKTPGSSFYTIQQQQQRALDPATTNPFGFSTGLGSISGVAYTSSSPVSSQDSNSRITTAADLQVQNFEAQLKASPLISDIRDRLIRCEYNTSQIHRDLISISHKVDMLVERALASGVNNTQPEFKDPFASNSAPLTVNKHRPSMGNIAPNQASTSDDMSSISQRLNVLTSSVGTLLALQMQNNASDGRNGSIVSLNTPQMELAPNQSLPPVNSTSMLGVGLPNRPDLRPAPRQPNPPMRTWSAGNLELPVRSPDQGLGRQEVAIRDKRRSVSSLARRDSSGVIDPQGDSWVGGSRDNGPMVSKWDQLSLAPELLISLGKFGVGPPNKIQQRALPFLLRGSDIIAQAPPTQERIAAYVIPAIQVAVTNMGTRPLRGPVVILVSTTVDQATQAQRMIRDLGGPIGVKSALGVGAASPGADLTQELRSLQQNMPHIICGTPQKLHALFTSPGGLVGSEVRFLVLDEVDQLIARNLHEFVFNIVKLLPPPRSRPLSMNTPTVTTAPALPAPVSQTTFTSPFEPGNPVIPPFPVQASNSGRRFSAAVPSPNPSEGASTAVPQPIERQTALFSNTVPQDVLNLATAIQLREPVRVLVRRDGNVVNPETSQGSRGLRQFYLYLAFTAGGRSDPMASTAGGGLGIIGSGRSASSAETTQAREWKLDALADIFDDVEVNQAIVYVGGMTALDSVVYKLASRGLEAIPLHGDMNAPTRATALNKFRNSSSVIMRQPNTKVLVVYDIQLKNNEVPHVPLVINYDLPKAVEEYSNRVSSAIASAYSRAGVVVNFVTATGGDVEMLRSIECYYKIKCPEVPMNLRDIL